MQIWVDADACPKAIKDILFRAAERTGILTILVANQYLQTPPSPYIKSMLVKSVYDMADNEIVKRLPTQRTQLRYATMAKVNVKICQANTRIT